MKGKDLVLEEFNKEKPPTFDEKVNKAKEGEAWLLVMKKIFKVHNYLKI